MDKMKMNICQSLKNLFQKMTEDILNILLKSGKASTSEDWDALYQDDLPIVVAPSTAELDEATGRLDAVGGYGYIATWKKNLFSFNPKLLSKRCVLIDENGNLLKAARIPKK